MFRYHMAVISPDTRLRRAIKRVTTATGSTAEFVSSPTELSGEKLHLAIVDARGAKILASTVKAVPDHTQLAYILGDESLNQSVGLFEDKRVRSLLCHHDSFDDDEFIASATKSLRGDVFGLQKYFPWGVTTFSMVVRSYEQKSRAIEIIMDYSREAGLRGPVRDRIQLVADELMMNALYHAPVDERGNELYAEVSRKELASLEQVQAIEIQYGCSGRYFGISVRDGGGSLTRTKTLEYLKRAENSVAEIEDKATGAGLGLISVLHSVSKLVFNIEPGSSTEVIALFDIDLVSRGKVGARSLHIFEAPPGDDDSDDSDSDGEQPQAAAGSSKWLMIALVLAVMVAGLSVAYVVKTGGAASTALPAPSVIVRPEPADAVIKLDGKQIPANKPAPLATSGAHEVVVEKAGYNTWRTTLTSTDKAGEITISAPLPPAR